MRFFVGLVAILASTTVASAESYDATQPFSALPKDGYLGVGVEGSAQRALMGGIKLDGGFRVGESSVFARAQITNGKSGTDGNYQQVRAGVEGGSCGTWACAFLGVDAGYQHDDMIAAPLFCWGGGCEPEMTEAHDLMAVPRVGLEVGRSVRVRTSLEAPLTTRLDARETRAGFAASIGLGYAF